VGKPVSGDVLRVNGVDYAMPLPGEHIMRNALRAIALGLELGLAPEAVAEGLGRFRNAPMRWQESEIDGIRFINDAYNANPLSMRAGLRTFATLPGEGRKWAVVGGMLELGDTEAEEHAALGRFIDELPLDGVIAVGEPGRMIRCEKTAQFHHCGAATDAALMLKENLSEGDRVLLKASRGIRLEQVLERFKEL
jgi:UDP-N-acetylmuramoyl-tripeptide--D-alanyl-D-alanine ligase